MDGVSFLVSQGYSLSDILDYDRGMTQDQITVFLTKATKQYLIAGRSQVEGMTVALGSLFKGELLQQYIEETNNVINGLEEGGNYTAPVNEPARQSVSKAAHERKMASSMQNLGTLTQVMQGNWNG